MSDYQMSMTVEGLSALQFAFDQAPELVKSKMGGALMESASQLSEKAKEKAPFKIGQLRNSIQVSGPLFSSDNIQATVATNVKYAPYQEYGTGIYGPSGTPIVPKSAPFLVFQLGDGTWRRSKSVKGVRPKYFMRDATTEMQGPFNDSMLTALTSVVTALATM